MTTNIRSNFLDMFTEGKLPELEAVILARNESYPSMIPLLFNIEDMTSDIKQTTTYSGLRNPVIKAENSNVEFQSLKPGFSKNYTYDEWATGYRISRQMVRDGKVNFIQRATESFSKGHFEVKEMAAAAIFTNGFSDTGPDGQSLFSTTHVLENGAGDVGSNRPAANAALSITSWRSLRNLVQNTVNENGQIVHYMPKYLVLPQGLQDVGQEILKSQFYPENANNAINTAYEAVTLLPGNYWPYLTDDNAYFVVCDKSVINTTFLQRAAMEVDSDYDKKAFAYELIASESWGIGYSSWRGLAGNPGPS